MALPYLSETGRHTQDFRPGPILPRLWARDVYQMQEADGRNLNELIARGGIVSFTVY